MLNACNIAKKRKTNIQKEPSKRNRKILFRSVLNIVKLKNNILSVNNQFSTRCNDRSEFNSYTEFVSK